MKMFKDSNWILAGVLAAACFVAFTFALDLNLLYDVPLAVAVFVGGLLLFKPRKTYVHGVDITKAAYTDKAEADIERWQAGNEKIKRFTTDNTYLRGKAAQLAHGTDAVLKYIKMNIDALYAAEIFLDDYQRVGLALLTKYAQCDQMQRDVASESYAAKRDTLGKCLEAMTGQFTANLDKMMANDADAISGLMRVVSDADKELRA